MTPPAPVAWWRKVVATLLGVIVAATPLVLAEAAMITTPDHDNAGGWSGWGLHVLGMMVLGGLLALASGVLWQVARRVLPAPSLVGSLFFCLLYSPVAGWLLFDAANVRLDQSPEETFTVRLIRVTTPHKGSASTVVSSWRGGGEESLGNHLGPSEARAGRPLRIVTRRGALGREYVLTLTAL